ncbi:hypothetical protein [Streptomyces xanthochromogenes]|uniref:hypothetical protein n=1 Tax=Streptomyces xanthochromogenes TaxID=67384 RepID=UPI00343134D8
MIGRAAARQLFLEAFGIRHGRSGETPVQLIESLAQQLGHVMRNSADEIHESVATLQPLPIETG